MTDTRGRDDRAPRAILWTLIVLVLLAAGAAVAIGSISAFGDVAGAPLDESPVTVVVPSASPTETPIQTPVDPSPNPSTAGSGRTEVPGPTPDEIDDHGGDRGGEDDNSGRGSDD